MNTFFTVLSLKDYRASITHADFADWITVFAYGLAAILALRAAGTANLRREPRERAFWIAAALLMAFFGVNELFDFQTVLTAVGKAWAQAGGWYEQRRLYQAEFITALAAAMIATGLALVWLVRRTHRAVRLALFGMVFIGSFVLMRAASFHHVDALLGMGPASFNWGSIQEMTGIVIVAAAAHAYARPTRLYAQRRAARAVAEPASPASTTP